MFKVVRLIAGDCAFVDDNNELGIRLKPATAIAPAYGAQFPVPQNRKAVRRSPKKTSPTLF